MADIPTTHVGSLPRGPELVPLLLARDHGKPYEAAALDTLVPQGAPATILFEAANSRRHRCGPVAVTRRHLRQSPF